jgi:anti-sigma factor RsiW
MRSSAHRRWERSVEACLDGELPAEQDELVQGHLHECPDCSRHALLLLAIRGSLRRGTDHLGMLTRPRLERLAEQLRRPRPGQMDRAAPAVGKAATDRRVPRS